MDWLQPILTVLGCGVASYIAVSVKLARHEQRLNRIEEDIGTHDSGMRRQLHEHASRLTEHEMRLDVLERRVLPGER